MLTAVAVWDLVDRDTLEDLVGHARPRFGDEEWTEQEFVHWARHAGKTAINEYVSNRWSGGLHAIKRVIDHNLDWIYEEVLGAE